MLVADEFLGTLDDPDVAARVDADALTVTLDDTERRRSRVRTSAEDGTDVGIVVGRELCDGDVLAAADRLVIVSLAPVEAMVLNFSGIDDGTAAVTTALELGHAVGNRHWDLAVEGPHAYLPVTEDRERMEAEVRPHLPDGVTVGTDSVSPALFDDATPDHDHSHGEDGHSHDHSDSSPAHGSGNSGHDHVHSHDHEHAADSPDTEGGDQP
jgi:urease accessory protein